MSDCCHDNCASDFTGDKKKILLIVLALNALMFVIEFTLGWLASSTGLMADSLDMLADAVVYLISFLVVQGSLRQKASAALLNGCFQALLVLLVLYSVISHFLAGTVPDSFSMGWVAALALLVNLICFMLLSRYRNGDINLRSTWLCSRNDMVANIGVIVAAVMVSALQQGWPDLVIGCLIALFVLRSALSIIKDSLRELRA
jgi:cation diffusion facilitator family transporter